MSSDRAVQDRISEMYVTNDFVQNFAFSSVPYNH